MSIHHLYVVIKIEHEAFHNVHCKAGFCEDWLCI